MGARLAGRTGALALVVAALVASCGGEEPVRIGVISDCESLFASLRDTTLGGAELPLLERGGKLRGRKPESGIEGASVAGRPVELAFGCDDLTQATTLTEARRLVERDRVDVVIGPALDLPGQVLRDYARTQPDVVFVIGSADAPQTTLAGAPPNVFRFAPDAAQAMAGLGAYAYNELGWRRVVTVGQDDGFGWTQVAGFTAEFCALGGEVVERLWTTWLAPDPSPLVEGLRAADAYDGLVVPGSPTGTAAFLGELAERDPTFATRLVLGPSVLSDPALLEAVGPLLGGAVAVNTVPTESTGAAWDAYMKRFAAAFPGVYAGSTFDVSYYTAMQAVLTALERVDGDLSDGKRSFVNALTELELETPVGRVRLDANHQWIGPTFLSKIEVVAGKPVVHTLRTFEGVEQTFGGYFGPASAASRDEPSCHKADPPAWAAG